MKWATFLVIDPDVESSVETAIAKAKELGYSPLSTLTFVGYRA